MPDKVRTETQIARLVGATPLQVELDLLKMSSHTPKTATLEHMLSFYRPWEEAKDEKYDGLIITGAPIELMPFEDVNYWDELASLFDWAETHVHSLFSVCWGAQAAVFRVLGRTGRALSLSRRSEAHAGCESLRSFSPPKFITRVTLLARIFGRLFDPRREDLPEGSNLQVLMEGPETGLCLLVEAEKRRLYMFNHVEYDSTSLGEEYSRDVAKGSAINVPKNYFPGDDPTKEPENRWRSHAHLLFGNWLNEVYQSTPYNMDQIGE